VAEIAPRANRWSDGDASGRRHVITPARARIHAFEGLYKTYEKLGVSGRGSISDALRDS
jgi:hypothetical protein